MEEHKSERGLRCIVKLGGAAITFKDSFETINEQILVKCCVHLRQAMGVPAVDMDWSRKENSIDSLVKLSEIPAAPTSSFVLVHGAGSFGHFQASKSGVNTGGLSAHIVHAGFVATRISVTKLNQQVVRALATEGIPAVGISPFAAGWSTEKRNLHQHNSSEIKRSVDAGFVPVLHGDAVHDTQQGCAILSGDVILRRLALDLDPEYVVFLHTNVAGVFDRPPSEENAILIQEIVVNEDGSWNITKPNIEARTLRTSTSMHDTTGGMATKISEAHAITKLGIPVYIVEAGTSYALQALKGVVTSSWVGTIVIPANKSSTQDAEKLCYFK